MTVEAAEQLLCEFHLSVERRLLGVICEFHLSVERRLLGVIVWDRESLR